MPSVLPLLGVSLLPALLVLAMACFSLSREEESVRLPTGTLPRPPMVRETPTIAVRLSRQGAVTLAGQAIADDDLAAAWQRERGALRLLGFEPSQATVVVRADRGRAHRQGPELIEEAQEAGSHAVRAAGCDACRSQDATRTETMKFAANQRHWWTRGAATHEHSLEGRWLPLLGLGGLLMALIFSAWRFGPAAEEVPGDASAAANDAGPADFHQLPAIQIRLRADAAGRLASIACNGRPVKDVADLRAQIRAFLGPAAADATVEAELDCDGHLRYEHTQQIIAAISACPAADGRTMVPLVDRVKFSPRKK